MIFSFSAGSTGHGCTSYVVRLPFLLPPGRTLRITENPCFELQGQSCKVTQESTGHYVLTCRGFETEEKASIFLARLSAGLIWFGLNCSLGLKFDPSPTSVTRYDRPKKLADTNVNAPLIKKGWKELDGHYDSDKTTIVPDHMRLRMFAAGSVSIQQHTPVSILSESLSDGIGDGRSELVREDAKLWLACEVYLSSHFESSQNASFLRRITTLEILVEDEVPTEPVGAITERFLEEAKAAEKKAKAELAETCKSGAEIEATASDGKGQVVEDFQSLVSRLEKLRHRSIKSGIRTLIRRTLTREFGADEAQRVATEISKLYDLRSNLVHSGKSERSKVGDANNRLNEVVPRILKTRYRETTRV